MKSTFLLCSALSLALGAFCACSKNNLASGNREEGPGDKSVVASTEQAGDISIALGANAWVTQSGSGEKVTSSGLADWTSSNAIFSAYFRTNTSGALQVSLRLKVPSGSSKIKVTIAGQSQTLTATGSGYHTVAAGNFTLTDTGYIKVDLQGVSKTGGYFADVSDMVINGAATTGKVVFVPNNADVYWSRRGPSVHLGYTKPAADITYFYNEITVPQGQDPIGSYYMANGFGQGYFGIQVNSATERRVLFSIWSPYSTDDPNAIPDSMKIKLLKKGPGVVTGEFGNEGSGGQSYLVYNWQAGQTYKFLTQAYPDGQGNTIYTSWFYPPGASNWQLIASFKRPKTNTYLTGLHSFLESFSPDKGYIGRRANYSNQWARDVSGNWHELTTARFTGDATASNQARLDFAGGLSGSSFYLRNCGFFGQYVSIGQSFTRPAGGQQPNINFNNLP